MLALCALVIGGFIGGMIGAARASSKTAELKTEIAALQGRVQRISPEEKEEEAEQSGPVD